MAKVISSKLFVLYRSLAVYYHSFIEIYILAAFFKCALLLWGFQNWRILGFHYYFVYSVCGGGLVGGLQS